MPIGDNWLSLNSTNGSYSQENSLNYPSPFLMFENWMLPTSIKDLWKLLLFGYFSSATLNPVIDKLSTYIITNIIYLNKLAPEEKEAWDKILNEILDIRGHLVELGIDYFLFGNTASGIYIPFLRFLECINCRAEYNTDEPGVEWIWKKDDLHVFCPKCGLQPAVAKDLPIANLNQSVDYNSVISKFNLIRWNVFDIDIDVPEDLSGVEDIYYTIPEETKKRVLAGDKDVINRIPEAFIRTIQAHVKKRKPLKVKLDKNRVKFLKRPMPSNYNRNFQGFGMPIAVCTLREMMYQNVMRRAQSVIFKEHIIPFRIFSPVLAGRDPLDFSNSDFRSQVIEHYDKWQKNPRHVMTSPVPIEVQQVGGQGRALLLSQEMEMNENTMIQGTGAPRELIKGGLSFSGSNVSLRVLENGFYYITQNFNQIINWIIGIICEYIPLKRARAMLKSFKAADDIQRQSLLAALNERGIVSDKKLGDILDFDSKEEQQIILEELKEKAKNKYIAEQVGQKFALKIQETLQLNNPKSMDGMNNPINPEQVEQLFEQMKGVPIQQQDEILQQISQQGPGGILMTENLKDRQDLSPTSGIKFIMSLIGQPPEVIAQREMDLMQKSPEEFQIYLQMKSMYMQQEDVSSSSKIGKENVSSSSHQGVDMRPLPDKLPPRRQNSMI